MSEREQQTEEASQHRREEARQSGNVPRSRDLTAALGLLAACVALQWLGPSFFGRARIVFSEAIAGIASESRLLSLESASIHVSRQAFQFLLMAVPLGIALAIGSTASGVLQGGLLFRWQSLGPDLSRLSPTQGLARILRLRNGVRGLFSLGKVAMVGWLGFRSILHLLKAGRSPLDSSASFVKDVWGRLWVEASALSVRVAGALAVLAFLDYGFQRWLHGRDLRMSRSEMIQELNELEGNPELKSRRRGLRKLMLQRARSSEAGA